MGFGAKKEEEGSNISLEGETRCFYLKKGAATHHFPLSYGIKSRSWNIPDLTLIQFPPPTLSSSIRTRSFFFFLSYIFRYIFPSF